METTTKTLRRPRTKSEVIDGISIPVPYIVQDAVTILVKGVPQTKELTAPYVELLRKGEKARARNSVLREIALEVHRQSYSYIHGIRGHIAVSENLRPDETYIEWNKDGSIERIWVNESFYAEYAWDADGDLIVLATSKKRKRVIAKKTPPPTASNALAAALSAAGFEGETEIVKVEQMAVPIKFPITRLCEPMKVVRKRPRERFYDLDMDDLKPAMERELEAQQDEFKFFTKVHTPNEVGLNTSGLNCKDLRTLWVKRLQKQTESTPFFKWMEWTTYADGSRYDIIEGDLKSSRKDHINKEGQIVWSTQLHPGLRPLMTSSSYAGRMSLEEIDELYVNQDYKKWFKKAFSLELQNSDFIESTPGKERDKQEPVLEIVDNKIVARLAQANMLEVLNYQHPLVPGMPFQLIFLKNKYGHVCALTDVKREDGKDFGLTYGFLLPPVYNARLKVWEFGIEALERCLQMVVDEEGNHVSGFDTDVINPVTEEVVRRFGEKLSDFDLTYRMSRLQQLITEHCGKYGFPIPMKKTPKGVVPLEGAIRAGCYSVTVDFCDLDLTMKERFDLLKNCGVKLNVAGSKSNRLNVRKYPLANNNGGAIFSHPKAHISRPGKQLSQISKGLKQFKARVAIVEADTKSQCWVTPSGIEKQRLDSAFLPKVYTSKEDALMELREDQIEELKYSTWTGEVRVAYKAGIRSTIEIGKIIDYNGNKFMPARMSQVTSKDGDIDFLIPWTELASKGNLNAIIGNKEPEVISIETRSGQLEVRAIVVEVDMFRSGAGTENICGGKCLAKTKGLDKFAVNSSIEKVKQKGFEIDWKEWEPKLEYLDSLVKLAKELVKK